MSRVSTKLQLMRKIELNDLLGYGHKVFGRGPAKIPIQESVMVAFK